MFEVHLPNASPAGDPSPVVTKVTKNIHVPLFGGRRPSIAENVFIGKRVGFQGVTSVLVQY